MDSARFHSIRDRVLAAVDNVFAEPVRLSFFDRDAPDQTRPSLVLEAVLRVGEGKATRAAEANRGWRTRLSASKAELHIDRSKYTGPQPKQGDRVRAVSRHGQPWFEVAHVDDRSHTRLVLGLTEG